LHIPVILGSLVTSRRPEYSRLMLSVLCALPAEQRENHESLRTFFISERLHAASVTEGFPAPHLSIMSPVPNQSRLTTWGVRLGCNSTLSARRGCAVRSGK